MKPLVMSLLDSPVRLTPHWTAESRDEHHLDGGSEQEDAAAALPVS